MKNIWEKLRSWAAGSDINERFAKAVEMLGATRPSAGGGTEPSLEIRLGGIYALERLARDSARDYPTIVKILCAYVRENAKWKEEEESEKSEKEPRTDIQAALTILGGEVWNRASAKRDDRPPMDLSCADLRRAKLDGAHLEGADLFGAHLEGAHLFGAHLQGAKLFEAHFEGADLGGAGLEYAWLVGAHLQGAFLRWADLEGAYLGRAHLEGAGLLETHLDGAYLSDAIGLTQDQINSTYGNELTLLPEGLTCPKRWKMSEVGSKKSEEGRAKEERNAGTGAASGPTDQSSGSTEESSGSTGGASGLTGGPSKPTRRPSKSNNGLSRRRIKPPKPKEVRSAK